MRGRRALKIIIGFLLLLAVVLGVLLYLKTTYEVQTVYVEGNVHYTEEEIKELVMSGPLGNNSLYLSMKYKNKGIEGIPFVDVMDVTVLAPDSIRITVYEKMLTGYVKYMDTYMYFDKDGYVVESSSVRTEGVPQVTGLSFDHIVVGEQLPVSDTKIFENVLNLTKLLSKYELSAEKIYFGTSGEMTVYFDDVKVELGSDSVTLEDKIMLLPQLLPSLSGRAGTLQMTVYDESGGKYIFQPES